MAEKPFIELGGDSRQAVASIEDVVSAFRKLDREGKKTGKGMGRSFGLAGKAVAAFNKTLRTSARLASGAFSFAYKKARLGVLALTGAVVASTIAWNKEAEAQAKINSVLKANIRDFPRARRELDKMIRSIQKTTNFSDRDVEAIYALLVGMGGNQGFEAANRLTRTFLDIEASTGGSFRAVEMAKKTGKALQLRDPGEFREVGLVINKAKFRQDPIGTLLEKLGPLGGGAAEAASQANPFRRTLNNFMDVVEKIGSIFASRINPALARFTEILIALNDIWDVNNQTAFWDNFKKKSAEAWSFVTKFAIASFASIKAFVFTIFSRTFGGSGNQPSAQGASMVHQAGSGPMGLPTMTELKAELADINKLIASTGPGKILVKLRKRARAISHAIKTGDLSGLMTGGGGGGGLSGAVGRFTSPETYTAALGAAGGAFDETAKRIGLDMSVFSPTKQQQQQQPTRQRMRTSDEVWQMNQAKNALEFAQADRYFREKFANSSYYESEGSFGQGLSGQDFADARIMFPHVMGFQSNRSHFKSLYGRTNESLSADTDKLNFSRGAIVAVN